MLEVCEGEQLAENYGRYEFYVSRELPAVCLFWATDMVSIPEDQGPIDRLALQEVSDATVWRVDLHDGVSISKATCRKAGCVAACRVLGIRRTEDNAIAIAAVYRNQNEPGFEACAGTWPDHRPPEPEDETDE